jgi:nitroreductase
MDFFEVVKNRHSIRSFERNQEIPEAVLNRILETTIKAPSAGNQQSWEFIIVTKQELKDQLVKAALGQNFIAEAPVVIVVCANQARSAEAYGKRGKELYSFQDTAAAIMTMLFTITALGYGACWVGAFHEESVRVILKIPEEIGIRPVAIIPIGVPKEKLNPTPRIPLKELQHFEIW